jgi:hypothetical protein
MSPSAQSHDVVPLDLTDDERRTRLARITERRRRPAPPWAPLTEIPHPYDSPGLGPLDFMRAVMHDPSAPMWLRVKAAEYALPYEEQRQPTLFACGDKDVVTVIRITGLPDTPASEGTVGDTPAHEASNIARVSDG